MTTFWSVNPSGVGRFSKIPQRVSRIQQHREISKDRSFHNAPKYGIHVSVRMLNKHTKPNLDIQLQSQQPQHRNTCLDTVCVSVSCHYYLLLAVERRDRSLTLRRQDLSLLQSVVVSSLLQFVTDSSAREKLNTALTRLSRLQCVAVRCSALQCFAV